MKTVSMAAPEATVLGRLAAGVTSLIFRVELVDSQLFHLI